MNVISSKNQCASNFSARQVFVKKIRKVCSGENSSTPVHADDIKDFAETTMNELLGWYGYDKLDTREAQSLNLQRFASTNDHHHSSTVHRELSNRQTKQQSHGSSENLMEDEAEESDSSPTVAENAAGSTNVSLQTSLLDDKQNKDSSSKESPPNIPPGCIICGWCQKVGMKLFTLRTTSGTKAFCSELCFTQNRRANFKKNKICDWCKHVRHTVNYVDFQNGEQQLQFCSNKCLNQYKMNIFCKETQAHLQMHPHLKQSSKPTSSAACKLITPDLWLKDVKLSGLLEKNNDSLEDDSDEEVDEINSKSLKRKHFDTQNSQIEFEKSKEKPHCKRLKQTSIKTSQNNGRQMTFKHTNLANNKSELANQNKSELSVRQSNSHFTKTGGQSAITSGTRKNQQIESHATAPSIPVTNISTHKPSQVFHGLHPNHIRPPFIPPPPHLFQNHPNPFAPSNMEMFFRMQGYNGMRHPLSFPMAQNPASYPMAMPPIGFNHHYPLHNQWPNSLTPPATLMIPYPVVLPIPIPIPLPLPLPIFKKIDLQDESKNETRSNENENTTLKRKVESVITKLVDKKKQKNISSEKSYLTKESASDLFDHREDNSDESKMIDSNSHSEEESSAKRYSINTCAPSDSDKVS